MGSPLPSGNNVGKPLWQDVLFDTHSKARLQLKAIALAYFRKADL